MKRFALIAVLVLATFGVADCAPTPQSLGVRVAGNHLVDVKGHVLQLRGVNRSGTQYACAEGWGIFDGPTSAAALSAIRAWHANVVRVSLNEDCWLGINGVPAAYGGSNYRQAIVGYVSRLNAQGLRVILDLHWSAPGAHLALDQIEMADRDHSPAFWASVAATFKRNPSVLFDLFNEPFPDGNRNTTAAWRCVRDGGTCPGVPYVTAGSQLLVNVIRYAGAHNVVLIGGPQYAGVVDRWTEFKPHDPYNQLAASIHIYFNTVADPEWSPCYLQACWDATIAPLARSTPIVIGEFGEKNCAFNLIDGSALKPRQQNLLGWADTHGVSYLAWSWIANGNCTNEPSLISNYNGTPTPYGAGVRNHLQR